MKSRLLEKRISEAEDEGMFQLRAFLEKIVSLRPDVVLATSLTSKKAVRNLKALGIKTVIFPDPSTFEEICAQFKILGELLGESEKAAQVVDRSKKEVRRITAALRNKKRKILDKDIAKVLGLSQSNFATIKRRNSMPYENILKFCKKENICCTELFFKH